MLLEGMMVWYHLHAGTSVLIHARALPDADPILGPAIAAAHGKLNHRFSNPPLSMVFTDNSGALACAANMAPGMNVTNGTYWLRRFVKRFLSLDPFPVYGPTLGHVPSAANLADPLTRTHFKFHCWHRFTLASLDQV